MRIAAFEKDGQEGVGLVEDDALRALPDGFLGGPDPMIDLVTRWESLRGEVEGALGAPLPLAALRLLAPIRRPGKIWAIGLNYQDHVDESGIDAPEKQVWFTKAVTALNGPHDPIQIPKASPYADYEVELVAVVGRRCKHVPRADAASVLFGYCVGNDVTERAWQHAGPQWSLGKSFDTHAPIGPWITTADEVDPHDLDLRCTVNGETRQSSNTKHLIFDVYDQIEHLSAAMTLEPGDLIFTGTPGGVGAAMKPMVFLQPGDVVACEVSNLGRIEARMEAEA